MCPSPLKPNRHSRPCGAYSHGPGERRGDRAARVESGVVLRDRSNPRNQSTQPLSRESMREANRVAALDASREIFPEPSSPPSAGVSPIHPEQEIESLRAAMTQAIAERRYTDALNHIIGLVAANPADPRWPHKYGDVLRTLGRHEEAAAAFRRSAQRYEASGFSVRAKAMLRLADELDSNAALEPI